MVGVSTLETSLEAALTDGSPVAASWLADNLTAARSGTPLKLLILSDSHVILYHLVMLLDLC